MKDDGGGDLEIVCNCADAMGWTVEEHSRGWRVRDQNCDNDIIYFIYKFGLRGGRGRVYDPLKNDEQAMELVKKFRLEITRSRLTKDSSDWDAWLVSRPCNIPKEIKGISKLSSDLNRAICQCVASLTERSAK